LIRTFANHRDKWNIPPPPLVGRWIFACGCAFFVFLVNARVGCCFLFFFLTVFLVDLRIQTLTSFRHFPKKAEDEGENTTAITEKDADNQHGHRNKVWAFVGAQSLLCTLKHFLHYYIY